MYWFLNILYNISMYFLLKIIINICDVKKKKKKEFVCI